MSVHLLAQIEAKPGREAALLALLHTLMAATRQEPACLQYDLWQARDQPTAFVMVERWLDEPSLEHHDQLPHFQTFMREAEPLLARPLEVQLYQPAG